MPHKAYRSFNVQFEKGSLSEATLLGRNYLVAPVVAMVEGVRFGANQEDAELGLASEFGDTPIVWANRPLVLNHPKTGNSFVSANTPDIMDLYQFGITMNPTLSDDGTRLRMEAWIDTERVEQLGGDFKDTVDRIRSEGDVEVSVGFFSDVEKRSGVFKGQAYSGIWRSIKPDHLAVLSDGLTGACSVIDGCGVPRLNETGETTMTLPTGTTVTSQELKVACDCEDDKAPVTQGSIKKLIAAALKPFTQSKEEKDLEAHLPEREINQAIFNQVTKSQEVNPRLLSTDNHNMIQKALEAKFGFAYLYGFTNELAVYERYDRDTGSFKCFQIKVNVGDSSVEFVGEPEEVILQTRIVTPTAPVITEAVTQATTGENDMATQPTPTPTTPPTNPPTEPPVPNVLTAQEYIDQAPAEIRDVLASSLKAHQATHTAAVKTLMGAKGNKFTEDYLKGQSLEVLDNMISLLPASYDGVAPAMRPRLATNAEGEDSGNVPVRRVFERKEAAA